MPNTQIYIYIYQIIYEWETEEVSEEFIDRYILNACGKRPKRWEWQLLKRG